KTFIIIPHEGFGEHNALWEPKLAGWPRPSIALIADTWLAVPKGAPREGALKVGTETLRPRADALLYLGPRNELTLEPLPPDIYRDEAYVKELDRRSKICMGQPLDLAKLTKPRPTKWAEVFPDGDVFIRKK